MHFRSKRKYCPKTAWVPVAAAAFLVLGNGQFVSVHLKGKGHTIQLPRLPVRWKGPSKV